VFIKVDRQSGAIADVAKRAEDEDDASLQFEDDDIDLRGKGGPAGLGFVDSHTHVFLYSY